MRLHARIAEGLESLYGDDVEAHAAELAYHFAQAESLLGTEKLVKYSLAAGDKALNSYAWEEAQAHFERGLAARAVPVGGTDPAVDSEAAALLFGYGRCRASTGQRLQMHEAVDMLARAFDYYVANEEVATAVAVASCTVPMGDARTGMGRIIRTALSMVPGNSLEAGRLLSGLGYQAGRVEGDYEQATKALAQALSIARSEGDVQLEVQTLTYAASVSAQQLRWQDSVENGLRAIELATGHENPFSDLVSRFWTALGLLAMGDLDRARPHALVMGDLVERRSNSRLHASDNFSAITSLSCLEGDWKAARESSARGLELSPLNSRLLEVRVLLEHETGEPAQGENYLEQLLEAMRRAEFFASARVSIAIPAIARITGVPNRLGIAEAAAESLLLEQSVFPLRAMWARAGMSLLAVEEGDQSAASEHYDYLLGQRGTMISTVSSCDRLLGLLSQTMGNPDQAASHFKDALTFSRKAGYRPELAWTCCDYADALRERDGEGDRAKAVALLDESLAISSELGMRPLMERVLSRREILGA